MSEISKQPRNAFALLLEAAESADRGSPNHSFIHRILWYEWLSLPLEWQTSDIQSLLRQAGDLELFAMADLYGKVTSREFAPEGATWEEREFFASNFEASVGLILDAAIERERDSVSRGMAHVSNH